jgi:DNA (cytosine-5)-methyltransferase 1
VRTILYCNYNIYTHDYSGFKMPTLKSVKITKIKINSKRRIWIEGPRLTEASFVPGTYYEKHLDIDTRTLTLIALPDNELNRERFANKEIQMVSKRKKGERIIPIIDVVRGVKELLGSCDKYYAKLYEGIIVITLSPVDKAIEERESRYKQHINNNQLDLATAFVGIGISSHAISSSLQANGIKTKHKWICDIEGSYLDVAKANSPEMYDETVLFEASVEDVEPSLLTPVDVFNFSMPCTNHSKAGKAKKRNKNPEMADESTCLFGVVAMIRASNPAIITSENVVGAMESASYILLRKELNRLGYEISESILTRDHGGALEARKRYWFVATSRGLPKVEIDTINKTEIENQPFKTVDDILEAPSDVEERWSTSEPLVRRAAINAQEGRNFKLNKVLPTDDSISTIVRNYNKRQVSNPHLYRKNDSEYRLLTRHEHARAKLIPEHLIAGTNETLAHQGLGQSINYMHGYLIGDAICKSVLVSSCSNVIEFERILNADKYTHGLVAI